MAVLRKPKIQKSNTDSLGKMTIRRMKVSELKEAPYNPRTISDKAMQGLTESLKQFGLVQPIIYNNQTGYIVGGHQRVQVLKSQGVEYTDVVVVSLSVDKEKKLNITLNNPNITGSFVDTALQDLLSEVDELSASTLNLDELVELDEPEVSNDITLPTDADSSGLHRVAFILTTEQKSIIEMAIEGAKNMGHLDNDENKNVNGNAISRVCETFITQNNLGA